jgi:hypothetical protein
MESFVSVEELKERGTLVKWEMLALRSELPLDQGCVQEETCVPDMPAA